MTQTILSEVDFFGHDNCLMSKSIDSVLNMMFLKSKEYREKSKFMQVRNAIDWQASLFVKKIIELAKSSDKPNSIFNKKITITSKQFLIEDNKNKELAKILTPHFKHN